MVLDLLAVCKASNGDIESEKVKEVVQNFLQVPIVRTVTREYSESSIKEMNAIADAAIGTAKFLHHCVESTNNSYESRVANRVIAHVGTFFVCNYVISTVVNVISFLQLWAQRLVVLLGHHCVTRCMRMLGI